MNWCRHLDAFPGWRQPVSQIQERHFDQLRHHNSRNKSQSKVSEKKKKWVISHDRRPGR
jgi:hypothetical protein